MGWGWARVTPDAGRLGGFLLPDFEVNLAEFLERAVSADFYGADGAIHQLGNFLVLEVLKAGKHENLAMFERKAREGGAEQDDVFCGRGLIGRLGLRGGLVH